MQRAAVMTLADRFWARVAVGKPDECWEWTRYRDRAGYGQAYHEGRDVPAHRLAWILTHGPIPDGLKVLHRCDYPPCVNPAHLFLGTQGDNVRDAVAKGRLKGATPVGSNHRGRGMPAAEAADTPRIVSREPVGLAQR